MRAVVCKEFGPPELLSLEQLPSPDCGPDQVRIRVWSSGVNFVDALFVGGQYQIKPQVPFIPGTEISGEITQVGDAVTKWQVGDRVIATTFLGGFADEVVISADAPYPLPSTMNFDQGATFVQSYATSAFSLINRAQVKEGDWVVVLGAAGGVGLAAIDIARSLGAQVIACASTDEKLQMCIERGAHWVINYKTESLKDRVRELAGGGADILVDPVGGDLADQALRSLNYGGRYLVIGFAAGTIPKLPANQILLRNRTVMGIDWGAWAMRNPEENEAVMSQILDLAERGLIRPVEPTAYPLQDAPRVLTDLLNQGGTGKVCLNP